jgi:ABC-type amino acid transport substrate-binding protein
MKISKRLLLAPLLLAAPLTLAQPQAAAPQAEARAQDTISVQFRGSLRDAIQKIAEEGGLNVVVTGELDSPAEVRLKNVSAEQALRTVARAYSLKLEQDNGIYTLRPLTAQEKERGVAAVPATPPVPGMPVMPGMPPMGGPGPGFSPGPSSLPPDVAEEVARSAMGDDAVKERLRERMRELRRSGKGGRDVVARGRSLEVKEGEHVDSAVVYGGNLAVRGVVEDDAVVFGGNLEITGHVAGDAHAFGGNVVLGPDAVVEGDVSAFGGSVLKQDGAQVAGSTESFGGAHIGRMVAGELKENLRDIKKQTRAERDEAKAEEKEERRRGSGFATFLVWFAMLFGTGFLGQLFFPTRMKQLGAEIRADPVRSGVVGVLGTLAMVPITVVLTVTLIGIPVMLALWVVAFLTTALGFAAVANEIGARVPMLRGRKTQAMVLALGLLILLVVGHIPVLGPLALTLATLVAFGAVIRTRFGNRTRGMPEPIFSEHVPG